MQTRRLDALRPGRIAYTLLLREVGSVLNDATVWRLGKDRFWVFTGRRADSRFIAQFGTVFDVDIADRGQAQAVIAVQGDISQRTIEQCFPRIELATLPYFGFARAMFGGAECWIARLGYSGETGYELVVADAAAASLWQALLDAGKSAGLVECGFDAIDSLRIEAGHILFTRELTSPMTPFELGFARLVDFDRRAFYGAPALRVHRRNEPLRRLVGLLPAQDAEPGLGVPARLEAGSAVMTSACWSPSWRGASASASFPPAMPISALWFDWLTARAPALRDCRITIRRKSFRVAQPDAGRSHDACLELSNRP